MSELFKISTRAIDQGELDGQPLNRVNHQLSELADGIAMVEAFSHVIIFRTDAGLLLFDTSGKQGGTLALKAIRGWSKDPLHSVVYTHGHMDHVGGSGAFAADAAERKSPLQFVAHENVSPRLERYRLTSGYNMAINARQFGGRGIQLGGDAGFVPEDVAEPTLTYRDTLQVNTGGLTVQLAHARGETDDHTWAYIPERKAICAGDFFIWNFPNAGNPQKVQRYPLEWAAAMRDMAARNAELFLPAHGMPIEGSARIRGVLETVATTLETLVRETLSLMNDGATLDSIIHSVSVPAATLAIPYLRPLYDEPEFVVRNIWRLYGGWYDGNPAHLKPAPHSALSSELAALAGGAALIAKRALVLSEAGDHRLACHLIEFACSASPDDRALHGTRRDIYQARRRTETSLMAKGIFGTAAADSDRKSQG